MSYGLLRIASLEGLLINLDKVSDMCVFDFTFYYVPLISMVFSILPWYNRHLHCHLAFSY